MVRGGKEHVLEDGRILKGGGRNVYWERREIHRKQGG